MMCNPNRVRCGVSVILLVAVIGSSVFADTKDWISEFDDSWDTPAAWDDPGTPTSSDDAEHDQESSTIEIDGDENCLSFTGKGMSVPADRNVVIEASKTWGIGAGGLAKDGSGRDFPVFVQDGASGDLTTLAVTGGGSISGIDFTAATSHDGDYVSIAAAADIRATDVLLRDNVVIDADDELDNSAISVRDNVTITATDAMDSTITARHGAVINLTGDATELALTLQDDANVDIAGSVAKDTTPSSWIIEDDGDVDVTGNFTGVTLTVGTAAAGDGEGTTFDMGSAGYCTGGVPACPIEEVWDLNGYAALTVDGHYVGIYAGFIHLSRSDRAVRDALSAAVADGSGC